MTSRLLRSAIALAGVAALLTGCVAASPALSPAERDEAQQSVADYLESMSRSGGFGGGTGWVGETSSAEISVSSATPQEVSTVWAMCEGDGTVTLTVVLASTEGSDTHKFEVSCGSELVDFSIGTPLVTRATISATRTGYETAWMAWIGS